MAGVYRSSINLIRWRGAVPNALNSGRVDVVVGAAARDDGDLARQSTGLATYNAVQAVNTTVGNINNTTTVTASTVSTINANGAKQDLLTQVNNYSAAIWNAVGAGSGITLVPGSYVFTRSVQRGDVSLNDGVYENTSTIAAVNPDKARMGWGGWLLSSSAWQMWLSDPTHVRAKRSVSGGNDAGRYEVEEHTT